MNQDYIICKECPCFLSCLLDQEATMDCDLLIQSGELDTEDTAC